MSHRTPSSCTCTSVWRYRHQRGSRTLFAGDFRDGSMSGKVLLRCSTIPFLAVLALPPPPPPPLPCYRCFFPLCLNYSPFFTTVSLPPPPPRSSVVLPTTSPFTLKQKYRQHSFLQPTVDFVKDLTGFRSFVFALSLLLFPFKMIVSPLLLFDDHH